MDKLFIFPCNGNGLEAQDCVSQQYDLLGFIDDEKTGGVGKKNNLVIFSREALSRYPKAQVLAVPGSSITYLERKKLIEGLGIPIERFATVIHPKASVSKSAKIGRNVLIMAGVVITAGAKIGDHVCILPNSVVHHDSKVGDFTLVGSNVTIAGRVSIGENCYIGSGSSFLQDITVGPKSMVGMASNVIRSVPPCSKVAGNPARPL